MPEKMIIGTGKGDSAREDDPERVTVGHGQTHNQ